MSYRVKSIAAMMFMAPALVFAQAPASAGTGSSTNASAWKSQTSGRYVVVAQEDDRIMLAAELDSKANAIVYRVIDNTGNVCKNGDSRSQEQLPAISFNEQFIKITSICINGSRAITPESLAGKKYLIQEIEAGKEIVMGTYGDRSIHFRPAVPTGLLEKLRAAKNAL